MNGLTIKREIKYQEELDPGFGEAIAVRPGGEDLHRCIQCGTCSSTCPMSIYMDHTPRRIIAMTRAGFKDEVLASNTIWLCASCYACTVECPKQIKVTDIMYALKQKAIEERAYPPKLPIPVLAREFFKAVRATGRSNEGRIVLRMWLKTRPLQILRQAGLGLRLLRRGRLTLRKEKMTGDLEQMRRLLDAVEKKRSTLSALSSYAKGRHMKYLYYPGCSLKGTGTAYEESLLAVFKAMGHSLGELDHWNCCGATAYASIDEWKAFALAARNLALAEQAAGSGPVCLVTPCSACYLVLTKVQRYMDEYGALGRAVSDALEEVGLSYHGDVHVRHPLDVLVNDIGLETVAERVTAPLEGIRVACYYGCQVVRPFCTHEDPRNPVSMDRIMEKGALGAESVEWPLKTRCCGGTLTGTIQEAGLRLTYILIQEAKERGADIIATCCPLCQFNLECYQDKAIKRFGADGGLPVAFFTQIMGKAMGIDDRDLGLHRMFVPLHLTPAVV